MRCDSSRALTDQDPPPMHLVPPSLDRLPSYIAALKRGWSPDNIKGAAASIDELAQIEKDPRSFVESLTDREAKGPPIVLPDGTTAARLPGFRLWLWDTEFCGSIGLRWQPGTSELPAHVLGHIGYAVVPWKEGRGYAKLALKLMLEHARGEGLQYAEITTDPDNVASRRVIEVNGGVLVERFQRPAQYGGTDALRFRIAL
jgi:predicted acetyltransferase